MDAPVLAALLDLPMVGDVPMATMALEHLPISASIVSAVREGGRITDFAIRYSNLAASTGTEDRAELYGKLLYDVIPAFRDTGLRDRFAEVVELQRPHTLEGVRLSGEYEGTPYDVVLDIVAVPLGGEHVLSVSHDRTEQHQATSRLVSTQQQLERRSGIERQLREVNKGLIEDLVEIQRSLDRSDIPNARRHAVQGSNRAAEVVVGLRGLLRS